MRGLITGVALLFTTLLSAVLVFAPVSSAQEKREGEEKYVSIPKDEVVNKDFYLNAGDVVEISGTVNGDVIVAGGQVMVDGVVNGDLLVAGGTIIFSGEVRDDVRIVGGQVTVGGKTGRNLTVVGGNIEVNQSAEVGGGALVAGGNVIFSGKVAGDVVAGVGNFTLAGDVGGDVEVWGEVVSLMSGAKVGGDMVYVSSEEMSMTKGASVSGTIVRKTPPVDIGEKGAASMDNFAKTMAKMKVRAKFISFISALIVGLIMIKLFPKYVASVSAKINDKLLRSMGIGALILFLLPFVMFLTLITVIGIPIGVILIFAYITYIYLSKVYMAYWLGKKIKGRFNFNISDYAYYFLGLLSVYLVTSLLWIVGGLFSFAVLLTGLGASVMVCKECYLKAQKAKTI